ncbi:MAG: hypothetical protein J6W70_02055, partial [Lentisphaeria bacterium]|nr:hypothetical protein [Lentisphaeria bacterium]
MNSELEKSNLNDMMNMPDAESELLEPFESPAKTAFVETEPMNAEVVENTTTVAAQATGTSATQGWIPCLPSSLSAQTLFKLALTVETPDPARMILGFGYENRLMRECAMLIPHPIPSYYLIGIRNALLIRRNNPGFFMCNAID